MWTVATIWGSSLAFVVGLLALHGYRRPKPADDDHPTI